jgi:hypothetical protein
MTVDRETVEKALRQTWHMVDALRPPGAPGSYARGVHNGIVSALLTFRDNFNRTLDAAHIAKGAIRQPAETPIRQPIAAAPAGEHAAARLKAALELVARAGNAEFPTPPQRCSYPDCNCPFDAPADPNWCARGFLPRRQFAAAAAPIDAGPLIEIVPMSRKGEQPCGECHLRPGETCDVCGACAAATEQDDLALLKREVDSCLYGHLTVDKRLLKRLLDALAARQPAQAPAPGLQWIQATPAEWVAVQDARTAGSTVAAVLATVRQAVREYHQALDRRAHGGVAQDAAMHKIEAALGQPWVQGATLQGER